MVKHVGNCLCTQQVIIKQKYLMKALTAADFRFLSFLSLFDFLTFALFSLLDEPEL